MSKKKEKEEEAKVFKCFHKYLTNLTQQPAQHLGPTSLVSRSGLIYCNSSGGDVALSCCHIEANNQRTTNVSPLFIRILIFERDPISPKQKLQET